MELKMEQMVRYSAGDYTIECGPGDRWRWFKTPEGVRVQTAEDLHAMFTCAGAAVEYFRNRGQETAG